MFNLKKILPLILLTAFVLLLGASVSHMSALRQMQRNIQAEFSDAGLDSSDLEVVSRFAFLLQRNNKVAAGKVIERHYFSFRQSFHKLVKIAQEMKRNGSEFERHLNVAEAIAEFIRLDFGDDFLQKEFQFASGLNGEFLRQKLLADSLYEFGRKNLRRNSQAALEALQKSIVICRQLNDHKLEIDNLTKIQEYWFNRNPDTSLAMAERVLERSKTANYRYRQEWINRNIGNLYIEKRQYRKSLEYFDQGLAIAHSIDDRYCTMKTLGRKGISHRRLGQLLQALESYDIALKIADDMGDGREQNRLLMSRALVYQRLGRFSEAKEDYTTILAAVGESASSTRAQTLNNLGTVYYELGNYEDALQYYQQAYALHNRAGRYSNAISSLNNVGIVYEGQELKKKALASFQQALSKIDSLRGNAGLNLYGYEAQLWRNIGNIYFEGKQLQDARQAYNKSLAILQKNNIDETSDIIENLINLGKIENELGFANRAMQRLDQCQQILATNPDTLLLSRVFFNKGLLYRSRKQYPETETNISRAIEIFENIRGQNRTAEGIDYFGTVQNYYDEMILLQNEMGRKDLAFHYAERASARALLDSIAVKHAGAADRHSDFAPLAVAEVQSRLPANIQLLKYRLTGSKMLVFYINRERFITKEVLATRDSIGRYIGMFHEEINRQIADAGNISTADGLQLEKNLRALYNILIAPVADVLHKNKVVYVLPDAQLHQLPFAALVSGNHQGRPQFLVDQYTLAYSPCANLVLPDINSGAPNTGKVKPILSFGNASLDLKFAVDEVTNISKMLPDGDSFTELQCSESLFGDLMKRHSYRIIHMATHANVYERMPAFSHLVLGLKAAQRALPQKRDELGSLVSDDDLLTVSEISRLNLSATELVCLSACQTAGGKIARGEGVYGLSSAFMSAGARAVMTSLWKIDDRFTSELMTDFYDNWLHKNVSRAEALRNSQLKLIETLSQDPQFEYPHPRLWAAFIISGG